MIDSKEIDRFINETINNNKLNKVNNLYLSNKQISILDKYNIDYKNKVDIKSLIFEVEEYINNNYLYEDLEDLEVLSNELSEFNYYYNTNK